MSLTVEMLKKGISLEEIIQIIHKKRSDITPGGIMEELNKEKDRLINYVGKNQTEIEKIERLYRVLVNQALINSKINILELEYKYSGGKLRSGYITNLLNSGKLEENKYLMIFLFNRLKRKTEYVLEEYNEEYFKQEEDIIIKKVKAAKPRARREKTDSFENWVQLIGEENKRIREN